MIRRACLVLMTAAACLAAPAVAQTGSVPYAAAAPSDRPLSSIDRARDLMNQYGICIVSQHLGTARRALAEPEGPALNRALAKLATDDCLFSGRLQMSQPLFRGALYRAMYLRDFAFLPQDELAALKAARGDALPTFGDCVARLSPDGARALVMASPATRSERDALDTLRPALSDCLPPKQQVRFTLWGLQATLAEALYKRTVALTKASSAPATAKSGG